MAEPVRENDPVPAPLAAAVECVLLDHAGQLGGDGADANLSELAYVYGQLTGWTVGNELAKAEG